MFSRIRLRKKYILTAGLALVIIGAGIWSYSKLTTRGEPTSDLVIAEYIRGLRDNDAARILRLLPKGFEADSEVQAKLRSLGGKTLRNVMVDSKDNGVSSSFLNVTITGSFVDQGIERPFEDHIDVQVPVNRWYLILGKYVGDGGYR